MSASRIDEGVRGTPLAFPDSPGFDAMARGSPTVRMTMSALADEVDRKTHIPLLKDAAEPATPGITLQFRKPQPFSAHLKTPESRKIMREERLDVAVNRALLFLGEHARPVTEFYQLAQAILDFLEDNPPQEDTHGKDHEETKPG